MILIYMNTGEWGGVDVFVARFAHYLREVGRPFAIVDRLGSRLRQELEWAEFLTLEELAISPLTFDQVFLPSVSKLIDMDALPASLDQARLFTWIVQHHDALYHFFPHSQRIVPRFGFRAAAAALRLLPGYRRRIEIMFDVMTRNGALAIMDGSTRRSFRYFYPNATPPSILIPLPVPLSKVEPRADLPGDPLSIGYLGRMDYFKYSALGTFVSTELAKLARTRSVTLVAITVGTHVEQLKRLCAEHGIDLRLHGFMPNDQARVTLARETHVAVAMGTAALDIAATGHPCLYIDPAERRNTPPQRRFRFVHETLDYMVGEFRDFPGYVGGLRSLEEAVDMVRNDVSIGPRGRAYVRDHHDPTTINMLMLKHIDASSTSLASFYDRLKPVKAINKRIPTAFTKSSNFIRSIIRDYVTRVRTY